MKLFVTIGNYIMLLELNAEFDPLLYPNTLKNVQTRNHKQLYFENYLCQIYLFI